MFRRLLKAFSFANVCSFLALTIALGMGTAYAADTIFSADIVDGEVKTPDLADGGVTSQKIGQNQVYTFDVRDDTLSNGGLTAVDLAADSVTASEILDASITGADISDSSLTGSDILSSSITGSDIADSSLTGGDVSNGSLTGSDISDSSLTGSDLASSSITSSDIANRTVNMDDIDGADRSGAISIGALSNGRCTTITGNVSGAEPGDVALLTTNGSIPNGMTIYAQRALTDAVHIKVCNLSGATSAAITDLPVRVITLH